VTLLNKSVRVNKTLRARRLGKFIRLSTPLDEKDLRPIGRSSQGVRGMRLKQNDRVVDMMVATEAETVLTLTENGYGKRTQTSEYRLINRGGSGVINIQCDERNGKVVSVKSVKDDDELVIISKNGIIIRVPAADISVIGRNTKGVRLMRLEENDKVVSAARIISENSSNAETQPESTETTPKSFFNFLKMGNNK